MYQTKQLPLYKDMVISKPMLMPRIHTRAVAVFTNAN